MAKVYAPLMSIDASGTYAKWKGIRYVRNHVIPMNPRTANQMMIRNAFTAAVAQWHQENQTTKDAWVSCGFSCRKAPERLQPLRGEVRFLGEGEHYQPTQPLPAHFYSYSLKGRGIHSQPFPERQNHLHVCVKTPLLLRFNAASAPLQRRLYLLGWAEEFRLEVQERRVKNARYEDLPQAGLYNQRRWDAHDLPEGSQEQPHKPGGFPGDAKPDFQEHHPGKLRGAHRD